jgi:hypothetical protein
MAIHDVVLDMSRKCPVPTCSLGISVAEYVLMHNGWNIDEGSRLKEEQRLKEFCDRYHSKLKDLEKHGLYDYENAYHKDVKRVINIKDLIQIKNKKD